MILLIAGIAVFLFMLIVVSSYADIFAGFMAGLLAGGMVVFAVGSTIATGIMHGNIAYEKNGVQQLKALNAGTGIEGSFFIGSGYVNDREVYRFYKQNNDGSFSMDSIDASDAKIFERPGVPEIVKYKPVAASTTITLFSDGTGPRYEIYVPPGTVSSDVKLNLPS
jgi:hypothetical protein